MDETTGAGMMRPWICGRAMLLGAVLAGAGARAEHTFELGFAGPESVGGEPGSTEIVPYDCTLTSASDELGARGWCLGIRAENARLTAITTSGTVVDELIEDDGFQRTELTEGPDNDGAVSCVILSIGRPRLSLPPASTQAVAKVEVALKVPAVCQTATLRYADRLRLRPHLPIFNLVLTRHGLQRPARQPMEIEVFDRARPCDAPEPTGDIPAGLWSFLLPLTNRYGCDAGGEENMRRDWVAPFQAGASDPRPGDVWRIDFAAALAAGWEAGNLYRAFGLNGLPVWSSLEWLSELTSGAIPASGCDPPVALDCEVVDFGAIVGQLNGAAAGFGIASVAASDVLALAQTYVENRGPDPYCVELCAASDGAVQIWVNGEVALSRAECGAGAASCRNAGAVSLLPGLNRLTVASWQGQGQWRLRVGLIDPVSGLKLTGDNQDRLVFVGHSPLQATAGAGLEVTRRVDNPDCCPLDGPVTVTLVGSGSAAGEIDLVEALAPPATAADVSEVTAGGVVAASGDLVTIAWRVPAEVLAAGGVSYRLAMAPGAVVEPAGEFLGCKRVGGDVEVKGSWPHSGPLGVFADSHDVGIAADLAAGPGATEFSPGADGEPGTPDDLHSLRAAGLGLGDGGDSFHFAYKRVAGDFSATVRVAAAPEGGPGAASERYGLMARRDCSPSSRFTFVHAAGAGVFHQLRQSHRNAAPTSTAGFELPDPDGDGPDRARPPAHFRLVRRGEIFTSYASLDGSEWNLVGSDTWYGLAASAELLIGVACARGDAAGAGVVTFTGFECAAPRQAEIFENESQHFATPVSTETFDDVPDGELPGGFVVNCAGPCEAFQPRVIGGRLRLSDEGVAGTSVAAYLNLPVPVSSGAVIVEYTLYLRHSGIPAQPPSGDPNPGDGVTMAIIAGNDPHGVGAAGRGLGYEGLARGFSASQPSLAVESDTWSESGSLFNEGTGSPRNDGAWHLGLNAGGSVHSIAINTESLPDAFSPDGVRYRVVYESHGRVTVSVTSGARPGGGAGGGAGGGVLRDDQPNAIDELVEPLDSQGSSTGLVAFTAATGSGTQTSEIDDVVVLVLECTDTPETVSVSGPVTAVAGSLVEFDASGSSDGPDEGDAPLGFAWSVTGDASITGPSTGPRVTLAASAGIDDGEAILRVEVSDGRCPSATSAVATRRLFITASPANWASYDANRDGSLDITDPIVHLLALFGGGGTIACLEAMDFNGDGKFDITDPIASLAFLFLSGPPPARGEGCAFFPQCEVSGTCR